MAEIGLTELLISIFSVVITIIISIATLAYWLGRRFTALEGEIKDVETRLGGEIKNLENKLGGEIKDVETRLGGEIKRLRGVIRRLGAAFVGYQEFFIEFLVGEGVLAKERGDMVKGEVRRVLEIAFTNPISKEEWRRIKELLDKDELTLEEALELRELARKVAWVYGHRVEAWKLHLYASMAVGFARKKLEEEKKKQREKKETQKESS